MRIELEEPFRSKWRNGYLRSESDGRKYVSLYNSRRDQTSISYARYLKCVELGFVLSSEYEVDHRNDDKTDDRLDNLQVLTKVENLAKEHRRRYEEEEVYGCVCAYCDEAFIISRGERNQRLKASKSGLAFCCHEHGRLYTSSLPGSIPKEIQERIKRLRSQGLSGYKIAEITGLNRNTVMKYW